MTIISFYFHIFYLLKFFFIIFLFIILGIFGFFYCYFSILVVFFQSVFYIILLFSFFFKVNCFSSKGHRNYFFKKFIIKYLIMESCSDLFFFILYLCNFSLFYGVILLFKQGVFPFLFYFFILGNIFFEYFVLRVYLLCLFSFIKVWGCFLFSKLIFCLNFYIFNIFITIFYLFFCFNKVLYRFICIGLVFNNNLLIFIYWIFDFWLIIFYLVLYFFYYYNLFILVNWFYKKISVFLSKDFLYKGVLIFNLAHGNIFTIFIFCKVVLLIGCIYYSVSFIIIYFILNIIFIFNSFIILFSIIRFFRKLLLFVNFKLIVFILFFLFIFGSNFFYFIFYFRILFFFNFENLVVIIFLLFIIVYFLRTKFFKIIKFFYYCFYIKVFIFINDFSVKEIKSVKCFGYFLYSSSKKEEVISKEYKEKIFKQSYLNPERDVLDTDLCSSNGKIPKKIIKKYKLGLGELEKFECYFNTIRDSWEAINLKGVDRGVISWAETQKESSDKLSCIFNFMKWNNLNYIKVSSKFKFSISKPLFFRNIPYVFRRIPFFNGFFFLCKFLKYCKSPFAMGYINVIKSFKKGSKNKINTLSLYKNKKFSWESYFNKIYENLYSSYWCGGHRLELGNEIDSTFTGLKESYTPKCFQLMLDKSEKNEKKLNSFLFKILGGTEDKRIPSSEFYTSYLPENLDFKGERGIWGIKGKISSQRVRDILVMQQFAIRKKRNGVKESLFREVLGEKEVFCKDSFVKVDSCRLMVLDIPLYKLIEDQKISHGNKIQDLDLGKIIPVTLKSSLTSFPIPWEKNLVLVDVFIWKLNKIKYFDDKSLKDFFENSYQIKRFRDIKIWYIFLYIPSDKFFNIWLNRYLNKSSYFFSKLGDYRVWLYNYLIFREVLKVIENFGGVKNCLKEIKWRHRIEKGKKKNKLKNIYENTFK